jgi:hypothetical protein
MKINYKHALSLAAAGVVCGMTLPGIAGPTVYITPPAPPTVIITAPAPPPPVVTVAIVPDDYVYDGTEYVGVVDGQYYYLGPDNVWVVMDPVRLHRFQVYIHGHPDWHDHMTHNVKYRNMPHGHPAPAHNPPMDHRDHDDHKGPPDSH